MGLASNHALIPILTNAQINSSLKNMILPIVVLAWMAFGEILHLHAKSVDIHKTISDTTLELAHVIL